MHILLVQTRQQSIQNRGKKKDLAILRNNQFGLPGQFLAELWQHYGPTLIAQQLAVSLYWAAHPKEPYFHPKFIKASVKAPRSLDSMTCTKLNL